jgi:Peptidase A4 family
MVRRWCIALAGVALVAGSAAASAPAAAAGRVPHSAPAHLVRPAAPMIRPGTRPMIGHGFPRATTSTNWSGYVAANGTYTRVSASWTEPTGHCTSAARYSAFWVGLDGDGDATVEQTGTEVNCHGGSPRYSSWYEMFPRNPVAFSNRVRPGDRFTGSVTYDGGKSYTLVLQDVTGGWKHTVHASLRGTQNASAEVIVEAPSTPGGAVLPLTNFGTVRFRHATANGSAIGGSRPVKVDMVDGIGRLRDKVSSLSSGEKFSATWVRAR